MLRIFAFILLGAWASALQAQDTGSYTINLRDADIGVLAEQVSQITGRTLVLHPDLQGDISVVSAQPLDEGGVWTLFQSVLKARGFIAAQSGVIWQILPQSQALATAEITGGTGGPQDFTSRLIALERLPAADALRVIAPLVAGEGTAEAVGEPNAILLTDTVENVTRLAELLARLDADTADDFEVISLRFADASAVRAAVTEVLGTGLTTTRISADPSSNSLLVRGAPGKLAEIRDLVGAMDTQPPVIARDVTRTQVFNLKFGDAETIAALLQGTFGRQVEATNAVALDQQPGGAQVGRVSIQASTEINAVIANGTNQQLAEVAALIAQLDKRRAQVTIEAAIVEVSGDAADRLNVQLGLEGLAPPGGLAATSFGPTGSSLRSILSALGVAQAAVVTPGLSAGIGNDNFGFLVQALSQSSRAKLLSTPSITTMDNEAATIVVGQNVPFRTGSFATDGNTATPFTTIERRDVGIRMDVLPRVTSGDVVRLDISQEVSALVQANLEGAADLVTNKRAVQTTVLADNGSTIVLGGLISSDEQSQTSKVPVLGDAPLVGPLFRNKNKSKTERTLFVFLRPTILRTPEDARFAAKRRLQTLQRATAKAEASGFSPAKPVPLEILGLY
jgi:general secretion pathway protein D